ncbi:MAG: efflux RND transporter periplasmic adaptor subunit, partial [Lachnospiraceae bacterium]|nr:efflux RND transporter periplasmic adaptor subunit [Lachnospiraceae bacterium]
TSAKIYVTSDKVTDVLTVPTDAVYYSNGEAFVYTYVEGKAQQVFVEVGLQDQENAEIIKGLSTADLVITTWSSELYDDAEVVLKKTEAKDKKAENSTKEAIDKVDDKAE